MIESAGMLQYIIPEDIYLLKGEAFVDTEAESTPPALADAKVELPLKQEPFIEIKAEKEQPTIIEKKVELSFNYMGGNRQNFLVLTHYTTAPYMDQKHLDALTNILQRKALTLDDVAILNLSIHKTTLAEELISFFKPARMLVLGNECLIKGFDGVTLNQLANVGNVKVLYTHSFTGMMDDVEKKKAFWEQMKLL